MTSSTRRPVIIGAALSVVLIATGIVVWFTSPSTDASFGWFAYAPLSEGVSVWPLFLRGQQLAAVGLVILGLITAGVALGFSWGHGVGRNETPGGPDPFSYPSTR